MDYYQIGQRIRRFRRAQGLSQEQLAEQTGISVTHMSHIETGNTKLSLPVFLRLAQALGVRTDDLLREDGGDRAPELEELAEVLAGCDAEQSRVILAVARAARAALKGYRAGGAGQSEPAP